MIAELLHKESWNNLKQRKLPFEGLQLMVCFNLKLLIKKQGSKGKEKGKPLFSGRVRREAMGSPD